MRRLDGGGGPKGRLPPPQPSGAAAGETASAVTALKAGGVDASRSTESPASNSSTDEDAKGVLSKPQVGQWRAYIILLPDPISSVLKDVLGIILKRGLVNLNRKDLSWQCRWWPWVIRE